MAKASTKRRTVAAATVLLGLFGLSSARASSLGKATDAHTVSSGTFRVVPTTAAGTPAPGALTLTFGTVLPPAQYFEAVNTGTLQLTAASYTVAVSGGGNLANPSISLSACVGASWNTTLSTCGGTTVAIGSWTSASAAAIASTAAPLNVAARLSIRASLSPGGVLSTNTLAVVGVSVSSGGPRQVRAATVVNS